MMGIISLFLKLLLLIYLRIFNLVENQAGLVQRGRVETAENASEMSEILVAGVAAFWIHLPCSILS